MKITLKLEELGMMLLGIYGLVYFDCAWWYYLLMFIGPDIAMLGYLAGNKVGAVSYNLFHHKGVAVAVFLTGFYLNQTELQIAGIIIFGHSAFDRLMGYGLKYEKGFKYTHLGTIGRQS